MKRNASTRRHGRTTAAFLAAALAVSATLAPSHGRAEDEDDPPTVDEIDSRWKQFKKDLDLSGGYDALSRAWNSDADGAVFSTTLMLAYTYTLDYLYPGLGGMIRGPWLDWAFPEKDPFMETTVKLINEIRRAEGNIIGAINDLWKKVHADNDRMMFAEFTAAVQSIEEFRALEKWQRIDVANRVQLDDAIDDLRVVKSWVEQKTDAGERVGGIHHYLLIVGMLIELEAEASALDYYGPKYSQEHAAGQGFDAWIASLDPVIAAQYRLESAANMHGAVRRLLATGSASVFDYLIAEDDKLRSALITLRNERFDVDGHHDDDVTITYWYRFDEKSDRHCFTEQSDPSCHSFWEMGSYACGDFGPYCTIEPEQILALHKWFAYGEELMRVWAPLRVSIDRLWFTSGSSGFRPVSQLDEDMEDFLYARTGLENVMAHGTSVSRDPIANALERLKAVTSAREASEWNFIVGRAVEKGVPYIDGAIKERTKDFLGGSKQSSHSWAYAMIGADKPTDVGAHFKALGAAKFVAVAR